MANVNTTLNYFNKYLNDPGKKDDLDNYMAAYAQNSADFKDHFYNLKLNNPLISNHIETLLTSLGVPRKVWGRYLGSNLSIYELIEELLEYYKKDEARLKNLQSTIKKQDMTIIKYVVAGGVGGIFLGSIVPPIVMNVGFEALKKAIMSVTCFSSIGIIFSLSVGFYNVINSVSNKNKTFTEKATENGFLLASTALNVTAYSVLLSSVALSTPISGAFFVAASLVSVFQEIFQLHKISTQLNKLGEIKDSDSLSVKQQRIRMQHDFNKAKNKAIIGLTSAIILTALMAVWCFVPGGMILNFAMLAAIAVIQIAKVVITKLADKRTQKNMIKEFAKAESNEPDLPDAREQLASSNMSEKPEVRDASEKISSVTNVGMFAQKRRVQSMPDLHSYGSLGAPACS